ncbi:MAG: phosphoribosylformylglycinamidine synthase [Tannerella sp.]|jgi:phosphoribosylformylglycinamidine synthase|nr:phosphoribosylformylglycinamidine synthase [Tannerella sp.]
MIRFFKTPANSILAVSAGQTTFTVENKAKLVWLFSGAAPLVEEQLDGFYIGPRQEMITPWSTNAVEITQNMGIVGIVRIEEYFPAASAEAKYDPMLQRLYEGLDQDIFNPGREAEPIRQITDLDAYNQSEGLALSTEEVEYLKGLSRKLERPLTDSEVYGFAQVNSEHCRHKIFNGTFIIDGREKESSLFQLIKRTSKEHPNRLVSAYKDNVAFMEGPEMEQFAPLNGDKPDFYALRDIPTVFSLKAETHNFPTTVEPFNGAATGSGGEIRDRLGGGKASLPLAGTAVYMTSYPRLENDKPWEKLFDPRQWLYQTPAQILIKASNGASDFGNKYGQPLICGSLLTFEQEIKGTKYGYDKVIMLAGGVGYANSRDAIKGEPEAGEKVVVLGGDNYRIGMGGGAVSSVNTGQYVSGIELNAVQRANPEMQKRVANVIRSIAESEDNPIISIHDHGAGGHLNCLSELVEDTGGHIDMSQLPVGDPTLSAKEIIGNESQERMGILVREEDVARVKRIAERECAPMYLVGETTGDHRLVFEQADGKKPINLELDDMFGNPPKTVMRDKTVTRDFPLLKYDDSKEKVEGYVEEVLRLEAVACKDWLTNKVDRSVSGRVARQQCQGELQLPLSDLGAVSLDFRGKVGIATSLGHAPQAALVNPAFGSALAIAEALTNLVFAPLKGGLSAVSLSANWMWPCRNPGEDARLYQAVEAASQFACQLGINIPTGKDSLSMTQTYGEDKVLAPGTVIISAAAEVTDVRKIVSPVLSQEPDTLIYLVNFSQYMPALAGTAFAQTLGQMGRYTAKVFNPKRFCDCFNAIQDAINADLVRAGHDVSAGGLVTALLEMCFANTEGGLAVEVCDYDVHRPLFAENPGVLLQVREKDREAFENLFKEKYGIYLFVLGHTIKERRLRVRWKDLGKKYADEDYVFDIDALRDVWYSASHQLDILQSGQSCADRRYANYKKQPLKYAFPKTFKGKLADYGLRVGNRPASGIRAAVIREKGSQCERETAYALYLAGFDVKDVHMTDLVSGRETLDEVRFIVFCGGFANSDVLGSAKGWAGGFLYNEKAKAAIDRFYARKDTLSLGICNGCQLMAELGLLYPEHKEKYRMAHNESHKFESAFLGLQIPENPSVMLGSLAGSDLGIWIAHGEGRFDLPYGEDAYQVAARYAYDAYPGNPNGSPGAIAALCSADGRHLAMMPHPERAIFPWQCGYYPEGRKDDEVTPWIEAFVNARKWIESHS